MTNDPTQKRRHLKRDRHSIQKRINSRRRYHERQRAELAQRIAKAQTDLDAIIAAASSAPKPAAQQERARQRMGARSTSAKALATLRALEAIARALARRFAAYEERDAIALAKAEDREDRQHAAYRLRLLRRRVNGAALVADFFNNY
jgi:hypothetical protein